MSVSRTLAMKFDLASGDTRTFSVSQCKEELLESEVSVAMAGIIDSGTTWVDPPVSAVSAVLTVTEKTTLLQN